MTNDNYVHLILTIIGGDQYDLLPLRQKDIELIDSMIGSLDAKSKGRSHSEVLKLRFGLKREKCSLSEIGRQLGVTGARVSCIEREALRLLKYREEFKWFFRSNMERKIIQLEDLIKQKESQIIKLNEYLLQIRSIVNQFSKIVPDIQILSESISELKLSIRPFNYLRMLNIRTIGDLIQKTENQLLRAKNYQVKNFGIKSLNEIKETLNKLGLRLGMKIPDDIVTTMR